MAPATISLSPTLFFDSIGSCSPPSTPTTPLFECAFDAEILDEPAQDTYVLVTGGLGYIGSHTTLELLKEGYNTIIIDNLRIRI